MRIIPCDKDNDPACAYDGTKQGVRMILAEIKCERCKRYYPTECFKENGMCCFCEKKLKHMPKIDDEKEVSNDNND